MAYAADFVGLLLRQQGDEYKFGAEVLKTDPDPDSFDCAELVEWGCSQNGVIPRMPDGSWLQARHCHQHQTMIPLQRALDTQGALLFKFKGGDPYQGPRPSTSHVAVSLGNGSTIEARGRKWGVGQFTAAGRGWTHSALIPGLQYEQPRYAPNDPNPAWPGRYITQPPVMRGDDVKQWKRKMGARGWHVVDDGIYDAESERVCRQFQAEKGLVVDGIVGRDTWRTTWTAPITP